MSTGLLDWPTYAALLQLNADYADALDNPGRLDAWPDLFSDPCSYKLQPRENHERGLPLATMHFTSRGALRDRVYAVRETLYHDPYRQRHVISAPRIVMVDGDTVHCEASFVVLRAKLGSVGEVFSCGRYIDIVEPDGAALRFRQRWAIFDTEMILNSIIQPI
jgi:salicylate 5-hydroxylase small subunit